MIEIGPMLAVTLAPVVPRCGGSVPRAVERLAAAGARAVQLSAAQKGLRPRELDRQGRRELMSLIARRGVAIGGLDLMIPHKDYLHSATQDRATAAAVSAIGLAADLGRVPLSLSLPIEKLPDDIISALLAAADGHGVVLAVHAEHDLESLERLLQKHDQPLFRAGLDPAALIALGHDPAQVATRFASRLGVARLDDHATTSLAAAGGRCPVGEGELDILDYRAALAVADRLRSIVVELRDLPDPLAGLDAALRRWNRSGPGTGT